MAIAVVMSGGSGKRFWPLSRSARPKQLVGAIEGKALLELAIERVLPLVDPADVWVVIQKSQYEATRRVAARYPGVRIMAEPIGRNTAACIAYAATAAIAEGHDDVLIALPADHFIRDVDGLRGIIKAGAAFVGETNRILTLGILPDRPATGFGYIKRGERVATLGEVAIFSVSEFAEKPDAARAQRYLDSGQYLWNSGIFLFRASVILEEIRKYLPAMAAEFRAFSRVVGTPLEEERLAECYRRVENMPIDYGVMEKTDLACVAPADVGWDDVGNWDSFSKYMSADESGNAVRGEHVGLDSRRCVIFSDTHLVATIDVDDIIIVATEDAVLVSKRGSAERVKEISEILGRKGLAGLV